MTMRLIQRILALSTVAALLLFSCTPSTPSENEPGGDALTWMTYSGYESFLELLEQTHPDIDLEFISYAGSNRTGYSWAQMRNDDISDVFITSQILDEDLSKERLIDLSGYDFINHFSTSVLDQVAVDGGVYLVPVNYSMYGIYYNETLMEEHGWKVPQNFAELEALCKEIQKEGLIPGVLGTQLTGNTFSTVFNLAKTSWLTTPEGVSWEQDFLAGNASAKGMWEGTMDYVQRYIDIGMFYTDPEDRNNPDLVFDYLGNRKAVFCTMVLNVSITELPDTGDKLGMMPFISEDGSKNVYMYSPFSYFGISKRLAEPGNEKKLENAVKILSLLFSPEGQETFITEETPCKLSVLDNATVSEDSLIYDAQQALQEGRAFPMTYAHWEDVLSDMGQAYKDWIRGENDMDGDACIAKMDALQQACLTNSEHVYFCESTADFTLEETGELIGKALGSAAEADAAMVAVSTSCKDGAALQSGVTGKLYKGKINTDVSTTICPASDGEYVVMTMTGAQAKELARSGFDAMGDGDPFPYLLVTRGGRELEDNVSYQVAFFIGGYTEETAQTYSAEIRTGSFRSFLRAYLEEQKTVSPGQNPWE